MANIGILVACTHIAKFFITQNHGKTIDLIEELNNPAALQRSQDFKSDKEGRFYKLPGTKSAYEDHMDPKEHAIEVFAHDVSDTLNEQLKTHAIDKVLIFAPPHFQGLLNKRLLKHAKVYHVPKDYTALPLKQLFAVIRENLPGELD